MNDARRGIDLGAMLFGAILLLAGGYFLLRNTLGFDIPDLDWDMIWPVIIIAIGVVVLYEAWMRRGRDTGSPS